LHVARRVTMHDPKISRGANVTAILSRPPTPRADAPFVNHRARCRWVDCMQALKAGGADLFVEIGPGESALRAA